MRSLRTISLVLCQFSILLTASIAWSQEEDIHPPFATELGFKRLTDPSTPETLKQAAQSVYEVRSLGGEDKDELLQIDLTDPQFSNIEGTIDGIDKLDEKEKLIIKKQIQVCKRSGSEKECVLFLTIERGTAFLAGEDGSMLWTNAHLVNHFIQLRASFTKRSIKAQLKEDPRVAIFLFDQNGKLVFDPYENVATVSNYSADVSPLGKLRGHWYAEDTDFVGIRLDRQIGLPLKIGAKPKPGQTLYRPGFAGCTGCEANPNQIDLLLNRTRGPGKDSNGQGLFWTAGQSQPTDLVSRFLGLKEIETVFRMEQMVFFSADSQVGFSGGPILNEAGEVVGVFAGSKPRMYGKEMLCLSRGVRPPAFNQ